MKTFIQIQWTCSTVEEAKKICSSLVERRLIACANIISNVESIYLWKGEVETSSEVKVYLKTVDEKFSAIQAYILEHCSYEVPEILKVAVLDGNPTYLQWLEESLL